MTAVSRLTAANHQSASNRKSQRRSVHSHHRQSTRGQSHTGVRSTVSHIVSGAVAADHHARYAPPNSFASCGIRSSSAPTFRRGCRSIPPTTDLEVSQTDVTQPEEDVAVDGALFTRRTSVTPSSARLGKLYRAVLLLGFGCVKAAGQKNRLLRKLAFFPPEPPGYMLLLRKVWESRDLEAATKPVHARSMRRRPCGAFSLPHPNFRSQQAPVSYSITECSLVLRSSRHAEGIDPTIPLQHVGDGSFRLFAGQVKWGKEPSIAFAVIWSQRDTHLRPTPSEIFDSEVHIRRGDEYASLPNLHDLPLIIFSHGNSTDLGYSFVSYVQLAHRVHANVLAYDYHGYGASDGKLTDKTGAKNLEVIYKMAVNAFKVPPNRIIAYGQSIGTTSTCVLASKPSQYPLGGIILHSPIASGLRLLLGNAGRIPFLDVFHNAELIVNCPWPIQLIHGGRDRDVPLWHCQLLHELAVDPNRPGKNARDHFVRDVSARVEYNCGGNVMATDLLRSRTDRPYVFPSVQDSSAAMARWWSRRVHVWIAEEAGHNDVEIKYKKEYFNVVRNFITSYVT